MWFSKYLIFLKNKNKRMYKRNKINIFGFLDPTRINPRSHVSPFIMKNQDYVVL